MPANPEILSALNDHVFNKTGTRVLDLPDDTGGDKGGTPKPPEHIPLPNYQDPASRLSYAKAFRNKYGEHSLEGYGDIPLRINEKPQWGSDTSKNLAVKYGSAVGLNPALLYSSSMIEGQSGLYPGAVKELGPGNVRYTGDKDYPVSGVWNFGLDSFKDYLPTLKKKGITLNPQQRDFFALAHFNDGQRGFQMLDAYNKAGALKNNDFLNKMPDIPVAGVSPALHKKIYGNVSPRLAAARGLMNEGYFDEPTK